MLKITSVRGKHFQRDEVINGGRGDISRGIVRRIIDGRECPCSSCGRKTRAIIAGLDISDVLCNKILRFVRDTCYVVAHLLRNEM